jgi:hypothetical protein
MPSIFSAFPFGTVKKAMLLMRDFLGYIALFVGTSTVLILVLFLREYIS